MNSAPFYHGIIRGTIVAFGSLFSNVFIQRREGNSVTGPVIQTIQVPIALAPKEKWIVRLEQDPNLDQHTYTSLPRMSFEIVNYSYDASRMVPKTNKIICHKDDGSTEMYAPVPYNIDIQLYILTKTQEDGMQILEQILPNFGPDRTISVRAIPEMNIIQDIPIALNSVSVDDQYDGDFETRRFITHTLSFTLKTNLFGPISSAKPIYDVTANMASRSEQTPPSPIYNVVADPTTGEIIVDQWIDGLD